MSNGMSGYIKEIWRAAGMLLFLACFDTVAVAQIYINEIFFNPGGQANDIRDEYIELRGPANMSLANHYLIFLENELDSAGIGNAGIIENIFDLGAYSLGSNGFLTIRQKNSRYPHIAPGTTDLVNTGSGQGFGNGPCVEGNTQCSTIGASDDHTDAQGMGTLSNSGATAMLIHNHGGLVPTLGFNLDQGKDGLDSRPGSLQAPLNDWHLKWTILDSVGYFAEPQHTEFGRLYGRVNFGSYDLDFPFGPGWEPRIEPGSDWQMVPYEIEYLGRWGNSTGQTVADWHVSNLTDNFGSGYINNTFLLRQSGDPHPPNDGDPTTPPPQPAIIETNKGVPYGTILTGSLGAPNFLVGDYNKNGIVDTADYVVWRKDLGRTGSEYVLGPPPQPLVPNHPRADGNHDFLVNQLDYPIWKSAYGQPFGSFSASGGFAGATATVPEPAAWLMAALATICGAAINRPRTSRPTVRTS
jgi:hypothetical protein